MRLFLAVTLSFSLACAAGKSDRAEDATDSTVDDVGAVEGDDADECRDGADNDQDGAFDCDDDGCAGSPDCEDEGEPPPVLSLQADAELVIVRITERSGDFEIGFAETSGSDPWTGEDCLDGYTLGTGDEILVCHEVDGGSRELRVVHNPYDVIDGYTLFTDEVLATAAIVVIDADSDECWANHSYYDALGCDALTMD